MFYYFKFQCFTNLFQMSHKMYFFVNNVKCQRSIFILTSMYQSRCLTFKKTHHPFFSTSIIELYYSTQIYCEMCDNKNNYDDMTEYLNLFWRQSTFVNVQEMLLTEIKCFIRRIAQLLCISAEYGFGCSADRAFISLQLTC